MALLALILILVGLAVTYFARRTEGISGAVFFLLGLLLLGLGIYWMFFEQGEGAGKWLEGLIR